MTGRWYGCSICMRRIKKCSRTLNRQIREAVEIIQDGSKYLLNSKVEYNRCILPSLQALGPPPLAVQEQLAPMAPVLTQQQD